MTKRSTPVDVVSIEKQYYANLPLAEAFLDELLRQIEKIIKDTPITLGLPIQHRIKTWKSVSEKLETAQFRINKIEDLQDLVGIRILLNFLQDVPRMAEMIRNNFATIKEYHTQERLKNDQFGYSSLHMIIKLPSAWLALPTLGALGELQAEIQIRTLAQHIWASASHVLQYKQKENVPASIIRSISRVSALLETVDLEFERVLNEREKYRQNVEISDINENLNVDLIAKILSEVLPDENRTDKEDYSSLASDFDRFGIKRASDLRSLLEAHLSKVLEYERMTLGEHLSRLKHGRHSPMDPERLKRGLYFSHTGLTRHALEVKFGDAYRDYKKELRARAVGF